MSEKDVIHKNYLEARLEQLTRQEQDWQNKFTVCHQALLQTQGAKVMVMNLLEELKRNGEVEPAPPEVQIS